MKLTVLLLLALLMISCHKHVEKIKTAITKIEVATGGFMTLNPHIAISIDSSLKYQFYIKHSWDSVNYAPHKAGYYTGTISDTLWNSIIKHLEAINYNKLDTFYNGHTSDGLDAELIIHYDNKIKHIKSLGAGLPDKTLAALIHILYSYEKVNLTAVKQPIKFETTYQEKSISVSNSVSMSKKIRAFICEYDINGKKINGQTISAIFAEKAHNINDFGVCDYISNESQLVIIFKSDPARADILKDFDSSWDLTFSNGYGEQFDDKLGNVPILFSLQRGIVYPFKVKLWCVTHLKKPNFLMMTKDIPDNDKEKPVKTRITFHKLLQ